MNLLLKNISILPFVLVLIYFSGVGHFFYITGDSSHGLLRGLLLAPAYFIAVLIVLSMPMLLRPLLHRDPSYLILIIFVASSVLWSNFPAKVIINTAHAIGMLAVCLAATKQIKSYNQFVKLILMFSLFSLLASLIFIVISPDRGISIQGRWRGLLGHPNTLGTLCWVSIWASFSSRVKKINGTEIVGLMVIVLAVFLLIKANSMTSIICSLGAGGVFILNAFVQNHLPRKVLILLGMCWGTFLICSVIWLVEPRLLSISGLFELIGRDPNLTGRTELWKAGIVAAKSKLLVGWGFDSQMSVLSNRIISYGQFHNGYIDLLVAGGLIGSALCLIMCLSFIRRIFNWPASDRPVAFTFIVVFLIHNISEASIMHTVTYIWFLLTFLIIFSLNVRNLD